MTDRLFTEDDVRSMLREFLDDEHDIDDLLDGSQWKPVDVAATLNAERAWCDTRFGGPAMPFSRAYFDASDREPNRAPVSYWDAGARALLDDFVARAKSRLTGETPPTPRGSVEIDEETRSIIVRLP